MTRPILLAWSGGKDSTLALAALRADPHIRVCGLVTAITAEYDRISIHGIRRSILHAQARALGLPVFEAVLPSPASNVEYEAAWASAWGRDTEALAAEFIGSGYDAYLSCVDTTQLAADFAGRRFDADLLRDLPARVDPCGERGEFHTCVVAGPVFSEEIAVDVGAAMLRDQSFAYCDLLLRPTAGIVSATP